MKTMAELWIERAWDALEDDDDVAAAQHALHALRMNPHATDGLLALSQTVDVRPVRSALLREAVRTSKDQLQSRLDDAEDMEAMETLEGHRHVWALRALGHFLADSPDPGDQERARSFTDEAEQLDPKDASRSRTHFESGDVVVVQGNFRNPSA